MKRSPPIRPLQSRSESFSERAAQLLNKAPRPSPSRTVTEDKGAHLEELMTELDAFVCTQGRTCDPTSSLYQIEYLISTSTFEPRDRLARVSYAIWLQWLSEQLDSHYKDAFDRVRHRLDPTVDSASDIDPRESNGGDLVKKLEMISDCLLTRATPPHLPVSPSKLSRALRKMSRRSPTSRSVEDPCSRGISETSTAMRTLASLNEITRVVQASTGVSACQQSKLLELFYTISQESPDLQSQVDEAKYFLSKFQFHSREAGPNNTSETTKDWAAAELPLGSLSD